MEVRQELECDRRHLVGVAKMFGQPRFSVRRMISFLFCSSGSDFLMALARFRERKVLYPPSLEVTMTEQRHLLLRLTYPPALYMDSEANPLSSRLLRRDQCAEASIGSTHD